MYDVVTIGSGAIDVFVKAQTGRRIHKGHTDLFFCLGSKILVDDVIHSTGGGGTNTSVAFSRLGFKTGYIGKIGNDDHGDLVLQVLKKEKVSFLGARGNGSTGYSVVLFGTGKDRAILVYKGINDRLFSRDVKNFRTKAIYISSMLGRSLYTAEKILKKHKKNVTFAFNPSMYLAKQGLKKLSVFINDCDLLVLNREEAIALSGVSTTTNHLLCILQKYAKNVVITDGPKGACAFDGRMKYTLVAPRVRVVETTGAGDAFASGVFAGLLRTGELRKALQWGFAEAASILMAIGAKNDLLKQKELKQVIVRKGAPVRVEAMRC